MDREPSWETRSQESHTKSGKAQVIMATINVVHGGGKTGTFPSCSDAWIAATYWPLELEWHLVDFPNLLSWQFLRLIFSFGSYLCCLVWPLGDLSSSLTRLWSNNATKFYFTVWLLHMFAFFNHLTFQWPLNVWFIAQGHMLTLYFVVFYWCLVLCACSSCLSPLTLALHLTFTFHATPTLHTICRAS